MEHTIIIAGSGGQGVLFMGRLMSYAAMLEGKEVTWMPSYGAEMRGGTANCTVIISDDMIGSPVIRNPRILVVMNNASYSRFASKLLPGGTILYDSTLINLNDTGIKPLSFPVNSNSYSPPESPARELGVPASMISTTMNSTKLANMVMIGAFISSTGILSVDSVVKALVDMTPPKRQSMTDINKQLIMKGFYFFENKKSENN